MFRLMGRVLGLALCESIPLGIPLASSFFKLLTSDSMFPECPNLVSGRACFLPLRQALKGVLSAAYVPAGRSRGNRPSCSQIIGSSPSVHERSRDARCVMVLSTCVHVRLFVAGCGVYRTCLLLGSLFACAETLTHIDRHTTEALQCLTFSVPSRTHQAVTMSRVPNSSSGVFWRVYSSQGVHMHTHAARALNVYSSSDQAVSNRALSAHRNCR